MTAEAKTYHYKGAPVMIDEDFDTPFIYMINTNNIQWRATTYCPPMYIGTISGDEYQEKLSEFYKKKELDAAMVSASDGIADTIMRTNPILSSMKD